MRKVILVGGGGHALSVLEQVSDKSIIAGYADMHKSDIMPIPYLGTDDEILANYSPDEYEIHITLVYTSPVNLNLRKKLIEKYNQYQFHTFFSDTSIVTPNAMVGSGTATMVSSIVNRSKIGDNCIINTGAIIEHGCKVGNNVFVGPHATVCGDTTIEDNVLIGAGSVIRDGISICSDVVIGMGAIVTESITSPGVYVGMPLNKLEI